jgi:hypothetical protein
MFVPVPCHDLDLQRQMSWSDLCKYELRWEIVSFVDIDDIVDHHHLNFFSHNSRVSTEFW